VRKRYFVKIYDKYARPLYRFIYLKVNSREDSEDLTSEAFFRFWENVRKEKQVKIENPRALLYRIADNLVTDFYRKKGRQGTIKDSAEKDLSNLEDNRQLDLNERVNLSSDIEQIKQGLSRLKNIYQNVIIWRYLDEFSHKEIAQILGKTEGAVRVLVYRALRELKKKMEREEKM